jgi:1-acyl-sn-glycerol-3-phosphate acyltransferase
MLIKFLILIAETFFRDISVKGLSNLPHPGLAIFSPDPPNARLAPLFVFFFPSAFTIRLVAKAPLFKIPLLGQIMRKMDAIRKKSEPNVLGVPCSASF